MPQTPSFREELISQIPALRLLVALGWAHLTPHEALALCGGNLRRNGILDGGRAEPLPNSGGLKVDRG